MKGMQIATRWAGRNRGPTLSIKTKGGATRNPDEISLLSASAVEVSSAEAVAVEVSATTVEAAVIVAIAPFIAAIRIRSSIIRVAVI
jgi:hypothetical protein